MDFHNFHPTSFQGIHCWHSYWATMFNVRKSKSTSGLEVLIILSYELKFLHYSCYRGQGIHCRYFYRVPCLDNLENGKLPSSSRSPRYWWMSYRFSKFLDYPCFWGQRIHCWFPELPCLGQVTSLRHVTIHVSHVMFIKDVMSPHLWKTANSSFVFHRLAGALRVPDPRSLLPRDYSLALHAPIPKFPMHSSDLRSTVQHNNYRYAALLCDKIDRRRPRMGFVWAELPFQILYKITHAVFVNMFTWNMSCLHAVYMFTWSYQITHTGQDIVCLGFFKVFISVTNKTNKEGCSLRILPNSSWAISKIQANPWIRLMASDTKKKVCRNDLASIQIICFHNT